MEDDRDYKMRKPIWEGGKTPAAQAAAKTFDASGAKVGQFVSRDSKEESSKHMENVANDRGTPLMNTRNKDADEANQALPDFMPVQEAPVVTSNTNPAEKKLQQRHRQEDEAYDQFIDDVLSQESGQYTNAKLTAPERFQRVVEAQVCAALSWSDAEVAVRPMQAQPDADHTTFTIIIKGEGQRFFADALAACLSHELEFKENEKKIHASKRQNGAMGIDIIMPHDAKAQREFTDSIIRACYLTQVQQGKPGYIADFFDVATRANTALCIENNMPAGKVVLKPIIAGIDDAGTLKLGYKGSYNKLIRTGTPIGKAIQQGYVEPTEIDEKPFVMAVGGVIHGEEGVSTINPAIGNAAIMEGLIEAMVRKEGAVQEMIENEEAIKRARISDVERKRAEIEAKRAELAALEKSVAESIEELGDNKDIKIPVHAQNPLVPAPTDYTTRVNKGNIPGRGFRKS